MAPSKSKSKSQPKANPKTRKPERIAQPPELNSGSDSDDAPEAVTLLSAKKEVRGREEAVRAFHAGEKRKRREVNKEKERIRAEAKTTRAREEQEGKSGGRTPKKRRVEVEEDEGEDEIGGDGDDEVVRRMERAMRDAMDEDELDDSDDEDDLGTLDMGGLEGESDEGSDDGDGNDDDAEEENDSDEMDEDEDSDDDDALVEDPERASDLDLPSPKTQRKSSKSDPKPGYLPDHLFASAFAAAAKASLDPGTALTHGDGPDLSPPKQGRRKGGKKGKSKDIVVGSRIVRTLQRQAALTQPSTLPSRRASKFQTRSLMLHPPNARNAKAGAAAKAKGTGRGKGWERRAVNIGVFRTSGPALNFVRDS